MCRHSALGQTELGVWVWASARTFAEAWMWRGQRVGSLVYERDEWVVPDAGMR